MKPVSVPYRGATFLNIDSASSSTTCGEFPSPIGELHFSMEDWKAFLQVLRRVSVPYRGATFLNLGLPVFKSLLT